MNTEDFIRELKNVEEQYKNKPIPTFEVNISSMARDCRKHIELLSEQIEQLSNDNHVLKTSFVMQQEQIEELKAQIEQLQQAYTITVDKSVVREQELEKEIAELSSENENMQIMSYSELYEQKKIIHKKLINEFTEQLGIMDKEEDVLFSLKAIKSIINFILELAE